MQASFSGATAPSIQIATDQIQVRSIMKIADDAFKPVTNMDIRTGMLQP